MEAKDIMTSPVISIGPEEAIRREDWPDALAQCSELRRRLEADVGGRHAKQLRQAFPSTAIPFEDPKCAPS